MEAGSRTQMTTVAARRRRKRRSAEQSSAEWPLFAPQTSRASGPLGEVQEADLEIARLFAVRARALATFARSRPASDDRAPGEPGAMSAERWAARAEVLKPVSEWAAAEASIGLSRSQPRAEGLIAESLTLVDRLPGTLAALEGGLLTPEHLRPLVEYVAPIADHGLRAEVEAEVLRWVARRAANRTITTPPQLADGVRRTVLRRDARDAAQRALEALRRRGVYRQRERGEGLAGLGIVGTEPEIAALHAALEAYADGLDDPEDPRTRGEKMLACLLDLVLRPGEHGLPPVQVVLTLVAGVNTVLGGDQPAELCGRVVSAETARQLLNALAGAGLGVDTGRVHGAAVGTGASEPSDEYRLPNQNPGLKPDGLEDLQVSRDWRHPDEDQPEAAGSPAMRAALAAWEADWERRLWSGELAQPDRLPEEASRATAEAPWSALETESEFERELVAAQERWEIEFAAGGVRDPDPPLDPDPVPECPDPASPDPASPEPPGRGNLLADGGGWWSSADRAVRNASRAAADARQALEHARRLVRTAGRADAADETAWRACSAGRVEAARDAHDALDALAAASNADRAALADLLERTAGGGLAERPRIALVDALSGALVALTDLPGLRRAAQCGRPACRRRPDRCAHDLCDRPGLAAPRPTDGYRPGAALDRFVRLRDRRCRFPGCRRPVATGELDHRVAWPDGPTDVDNLAGFCTGHHRGKHQARGLACATADDGALVVTSASGLTATTEAPPF